MPPPQQLDPALALPPTKPACDACKMVSLAATHEAVELLKDLKRAFILSVPPYGVSAPTTITPTRTPAARQRTLNARTLDGRRRTFAP